MARAADVATNVCSKVEPEIERWRTTDLLDLLKGTADADLIGRAKQVKEYRDWVAHRNPARPPSARVDPETAFTVLASLSTALG